MDAYLERIGRKLQKTGALRVGFLEGATYPDGTPVALVAAVQNYGAPSRGIPPRPFFTNMIADNSGSWPREMQSALKATGYDVEKTFSLMGELIEGELKQAILDTNEPPLDPKTIRRKGFSKPLVDTGHMLNSTGYDVTTT